MKNLLVIAFLLITVTCFAAGKDILDFTADTSPTSDDVIYVVNAPGTTPADRQVTLGNAITKASGLGTGVIKATSGVFSVATQGTDYCGSTTCKVPSGASVAPASAGEVGVDTTSDQFVYYGAFARRLPHLQYFSVVVPSVADTDDMILLKAPYAMTISQIDCIVSAATSATINIQECAGTGGSCSDTLASDLVCDTDGAVGSSFTNASIDYGDWIKLDIPSISGTPGTLTVTVIFDLTGD